MDRNTMETKDQGPLYGGYITFDPDDLEGPGNMKLHLPKWIKFGSPPWEEEH